MSDIAHTPTPVTPAAAEPVAVPNAAPLTTATTPATATQAPAEGESATAQPAAGQAERGGERGQPRGQGNRNGGRDRNRHTGRERDGGGNRAGGRGQPRANTQAKAPPAPNHPVLKQLAELEPTLFGGEALPLKRGIFQDLMVAHPGVFEKEALKTALGLYTRSTRYLLAMASGQARHNLAGESVETVAPEHRYHSLLETFRRRHARTGQDVRQPLYARILEAAEASNLVPSDYAALVRGKDEAANEILDAAMAELGSRMAREEALMRAFEASGQSVNAFADAYGLHPIEAAATLQRAKARAQAQTEAAAAAAAAKAAEEAAEEATAQAATTDDAASADQPAAEPEATSAAEAPAAEAATAAETTAGTP